MATVVPLPINKACANATRKFSFMIMESRDIQWWSLHLHYVLWFDPAISNRYNVYSKGTKCWRLPSDDALTLTSLQCGFWIGNFKFVVFITNAFSPFSSLHQNDWFLVL